ncbi:MAG: glycosyltransferase [Chloroflexi bacterium]|nr:glycosyltransferase [Chloroflexota bacterium]
MSSDPTVSIVLPTYNGARYLAQAIESCLAQTYTDWELIVVDDASTDETPDLLAAFARRDPRIRAIRHAENRKLPGALNTGFAAARGTYLTWTSDDNLYRPEALAVLVEALEGAPEIGVIYADYSEIDEAGRVVDTITVRDPQTLVYKSCVGPCFLYRRAVQETVGPYAEDLYLAEDYDFWLRVSAHFKLRPLHQNLYLYRMHGGALTSRYFDRVMAARETTLLRNLPRLGWADGVARAEAYMHLAELAERRHDRRQSLVYRAQALRQHPLLVLRRGVLRALKIVLGPAAARKIAGVYLRFKKPARTEI